MAKPYSEILREVDNLPKINDLGTPGPEAANLQDIPQDLLTDELPQELTGKQTDNNNNPTGEDTEEFKEYYYDDAKNNKQGKETVSALSTVFGASIFRQAINAVLVAAVILLVYPLLVSILSNVTGWDLSKLQYLSAIISGIFTVTSENLFFR